MCRQWRETLRSGGKYWRWPRLCVDLSKYPDQVEDLLNSKLVSLVPEIKINTGQNKEKSLLQSIWIWITGTADKNIFESLLELIRDGGAAHLKKLTIAGENLNVTPELLAETAIKLETLKAGLSIHQMEAIFTRLVSNQNSRLRRLEVFGGPVDLNSLDPELVSGALVKLEVVQHPLSSKLSTGQVAALFSWICNSPDMRLSELYLYRKNISLVPPQVLIGAIQRLEWAVFGWGRMTTEQITAILTMVKERRLGRIKTIKIFGVAGMRFVSTSLLQEAKIDSTLKWID